MGGRSAEAVLGEELLGDSGGILLVDHDLLDQLTQRRGVELGRDRVEGGGDRVAHLGLGDQWHDVLRREQALGVVQDDEAIGGDGRVGGEEVDGVNLAVLERLDRQRTAGVKSAEGLEVKVVELLEPWNAGRTGLPLGRSTEGQILSLGGQVTNGLQAELGRGLLRDNDSVLVLGRRLVQDRQRGGERRFELVIDPGSIGGLGTLVEVLVEDPGVLRDQIDGTVFPRRDVDLPAANVQLLVALDAFGA